MILILSLIVAFVVLICLVFSYILFVNIFKRGKESQNNYDNAPPQFQKYVKIIDEGKEWFDSKPFEILEITSNKTKLSGYFLKNDPGKLAMIFHGHRGRAKDAMHKAKVFYDEGYSVFVPDLRGHSASLGKYIGFGASDKNDILNWYNLLKDKIAHDAKITLVGDSMGGAVALIAAPALEDAGANLVAVLSVATYSSLKELLLSIAKIKPKFVSYILLFFIGLWLRLLAGYKLSQAAPILSIGKIKAKVLIIHGVKDNLIPVSMVEELFTAALGEKKLIKLENDDHTTAQYWIEDSTKKEIKEFIYEKN